MARCKPAATSGVIAIIHSVIQSDRVNQILVGVVLGGLGMALAMTTVVVWMLK